MQELTFEQVDVVSGGTFWDIQEVQKELEYREQVMEQGGGSGGEFVGSTAHKYATVAAASATVSALGAAVKCTVTGPAYFFCVAGAAVGGAVGGVAGQALVDYLSP